MIRAVLLTCYRCFCAFISIRQNESGAPKLISHAKFNDAANETAYIINFTTFESLFLYCK